MTSHANQGYELLHKAWLEANGELTFTADTALAALIDRVFNGQEAGYKKAIIIQAAGKAADPKLDAQAMQRGTGGDGSWDAREFAKQAFVKWNLEAKEPFSHSGDPYVSNPYRIPRFDETQRSQRKRPQEFDNTLTVLEHLNATTESEKSYTNLVEILLGLKRWIADKDVSYPLPKRASLETTLNAIERFLTTKSGGTRLQAVVAALFQSLAAAGLNISDIAAGHVNATDVSSSKAGDVTFSQGERSFAAEVKDRPLTAAEVAASVDKARIANASDLMFVVRANTPFDPAYSANEFNETCAAQFSSGLNIYLQPFGRFSDVCLALIGEDGRRTFLEEVGNSLASQKADIGHKWAWSDIVKAL